MPTYLTRHMVATRDLHYGDEPVRKGERFHATEVDADYLALRGQAEDAKEEQPAEKPAARAAAPEPVVVAEAEPTARRKPGRPPRVESMLMTTKDVPGPAQDAAAEEDPPT